MEYFIQFLMGGVLMTLLYYYSKQKNMVMCTLIPALPIWFLIGLFYNKNMPNVNKYIVNAISFIVLYLLFLIILLSIFYKIHKLFISTIIALLLYFIIVFFCINKNIFIYR